MKRTLLAAAFATVLFSCQKSTDDIVKPTPKEEDLLGQYKITKLLFQSKGNPDQDLLSTFPTCALDDLLIFAADSFKMEDAGESCGEDENQPTLWSIKGNNLYIDGVKSEIISFDKHTLVISTPMTFLDAQGTVLETLKRQ